MFLMDSYICPVCGSEFRLSEDHIDLGMFSEGSFLLECEKGHRFLVNKNFQMKELHLRKLPLLDETFTVQIE